ncbi:MAG: hypothetical protein EOM59_00770 [Clostridia bacterium]|nr:hypothetical protein [Clostridia bacterium]
MKNIMKQELRIGLKPFAFWTLGLCFLTIGGMVKYVGFNASTGADITVLLQQFPKIFIAMFGMSNLDLQSLGGFYAVLENYIFLCTAIFAIHLGHHAVSREMLDKTYEFLFTKPRTRSCILTGKLLAGIIYLFAFCFMNGVFSYVALRVHGIENTIQTAIILYSIALFVVGLIFLSLSAMLSSLLYRAEAGATASNAIFIGTYIVAILFDLSEERASIKLLTPLRYFVPSDLLAGHFDMTFFGISLVLCAIFLVFAYITFKNRDLNAV